MLIHLSSWPEIEARLKPLAAPTWPEPETELD